MEELSGLGALDTSLPPAAAAVSPGLRSGVASPASPAARASPAAATPPRLPPPASAGGVWGFSPAAAASAAVSPASHNCFGAAAGSDSPSSSGASSAAEPFTLLGACANAVPLPLSPVASFEPGPASLPRSPAATGATESAAESTSDMEPATAGGGGYRRDTELHPQSAQPQGSAKAGASHAEAVAGSGGGDGAAQSASEQLGSDSDGDSGAGSDAHDGTWLPEFATPARRRLGRKTRRKVGKSTL